MSPPWSNLFSRNRASREAAERLERGIMVRARAPEPYLAGWVPDRFDGRFHMVALYSALVLSRLRAAGRPGERIATALMERIFSGFDHAYREEGVGDASIARKVRKLGERFSGLMRAVDAALGSQNRQADMSDVLQRNAVTPPETARDLAAALLADADRLAGVPTDRFLAGETGWDAQC